MIKKFKVGDKVIIISNKWSGGCYPKGHIGYITKLGSRKIDCTICTIDNGDGNWYAFKDLKNFNDISTIKKAVFTAIIELR